MLEKAGFLILAASSADSAVRLCRESKAPIQLVIVDLGVDEAGASEFLASLYCVSTEIRVLFLSNSLGPETVEHLGHARQVCGVLPKPFRRAQLLGQVLEAMGEPVAV